MVKLKSQITTFDVNDNEAKLQLNETKQTKTKTNTKTTAAKPQNATAVMQPNAWYGFFFIYNYYGYYYHFYNCYYYNYCVSFFASCLFCLPINVFVFFVRMLFFFASIIPSLTNLKVCLKFTLIDVNTLKISIYFYFIILKTFLIFFSFNLFLLFFQNKMIQFEYSKNNIVNTMGFVLTCDKFKIWEYGMNTHSK